MHRQALYLVLFLLLSCQARKSRSIKPLSLKQGSSKEAVFREYTSQSPTSSELSASKAKIKPRAQDQEQLLFFSPDKDAVGNHIQYYACRVNEPSVCNPTASDPGLLAKREELIATPPSGPITVHYRFCHSKGDELICPEEWQQEYLNHQENSPEMQKLLQEEYELKQKMLVACQETRREMHTHAQKQTPNKDLRLATMSKNYSNNISDPACAEIVTDEQTDPILKYEQELEEHDRREIGIALLSLGGASVMVSLGVLGYLSEKNSVYELERLSKAQTEITSELTPKKANQLNQMFYQMHLFVYNAHPKRFPLIFNSNDNSFAWDKNFDKSEIENLQRQAKILLTKDSLTENLDATGSKAQSLLRAFEDAANNLKFVESAFRSDQTDFKNISSQNDSVKGFMETQTFIDNSKALNTLDSKTFHKLNVESIESFEKQKFPEPGVGSLEGKRLLGTKTKIGIGIGFAAGAILAVVGGVIAFNLSEHQQSVDQKFLSALKKQEVILKELSKKRREVQAQIYNFKSKR